MRLETPIHLATDRRYVITIESKSSPSSIAAVPEKSETTKNGWDILEEMIGTIDAPADWSKEHDHYLYGSPKRYEQEKQ